MKHPLPADWVEDPVRVALIGCGGNGCQMLTGLARLQIALTSIGHPGLEVTVFDPDRVNESNIGRQLFSYADVGHYKANVLVHRLNIFFGLAWEAEPVAFAARRMRDSLYGRWKYQLVIGCVDSAASRRTIHACSEASNWDTVENDDRKENPYWLDVGNLANTGQVVLGQFNPVFSDRFRAPAPLVDVLCGNNAKKYGWPRKDRKRGKGTAAFREWAASCFPLHLPNITDLFPSILDTAVPEVDIPSCSLAQALESQDLFVNQAVTTFALQLLWMFFRQGGLDHHGYFVNLASGSVKALPIDREAWRRFNPAILGETPEPKPRAKAKKKKNTSGLKQKNGIKSLERRRQRRKRQ